jgi:DNA mismatch repair ATPase MutS
MAVTAPVKKQVSILRHWADLKRGLPSHICFVERNDTFATFKSDAETAAKLLGLPVTQYTVGEEAVPQLILDKKQMAEVDAAFKPTQCLYCTGLWAA